MSAVIWFVLRVWVLLGLVAGVWYLSDKCLLGNSLWPIPVRIVAVMTAVPLFFLIWAWAIFGMSLW